MPIYDFKCSNCGTVSEFRVQNNSEGDALTCPICGGQTMERQLSAPAFLKGGSHHPGTTCCGRAERCDTPPCSSGGGGCCRQ
jgi:putative FmdB family regulatory protein